MVWNWFSKTEKEDPCKYEDSLQCTVSEYDKVQSQKQAIAKKTKQDSSDLLRTVNNALDILNKVEAKRNK